jgi:hypothetical protein
MRVVSTGLVTHTIVYSQAPDPWVLPSWPRTNVKVPRCLLAQLLAADIWLLQW